MGAADASGAIMVFSQHEHRDLARGLDRLHAVAREIGQGPRSHERDVVDAVSDWALSTLEPHIAWEESWLYPRIDVLTDTQWSTRAARFEHGQIRTLLGRIRHDELMAHHTIDPDATGELRADLYALEALLRAHIEQEEELLLPMLLEQQAHHPAQLPRR